MDNYVLLFTRYIITNNGSFNSSFHKKINYSSEYFISKSDSDIESYSMILLGTTKSLISYFLSFCVLLLNQIIILPCLAKDDDNNNYNHHHLSFLLCKMNPQS